MVSCAGHQAPSSCAVLKVYILLHLMTTTQSLRIALGDPYSIFVGRRRTNMNFQSCDQVGCYCSLSRESTPAADWSLPLYFYVIKGGRASDRLIDELSDSATLGTGATNEGR